MKISFVKREGKNALGIRFVLDKKITIAGVAELRRDMTADGFKETWATNKYTDRELARMAKGAKK